MEHLSFGDVKTFHMYVDKNETTHTQTERERACACACLCCRMSAKLLKWVGKMKVVYQRKLKIKMLLITQTRY